MDDSRIKTINDNKVVRVEFVIDNTLECFKTLQEELDSFHSESPIRDIHFNQEFSRY